MSRCVKSSSEIKLSPAYKLEYEQFVNDCDGQGIVLRHIKSGARICVVSNSDENKVFCIGFRTPPKNDTGVAHIIEHSVLCGSRKFPAKDPFMELSKGSLNTFLNAFTFPDRTCYPVASCNDKDFANLMDVYMDAVLHPAIYEHEEIFKQEGWHYELNAKDEPVTINGIVYSEMKGAFSAPDDILGRMTFSALFPNTAYGTESGGDPVSIPDLSYEEFLNFHRQYYHPSNSYVYLYGNMDIEERLEWLDKAYLSNYDVIEVDSEIKVQQPIGSKKDTLYYSKSEGEPLENESYLSWAFCTGRTEDVILKSAVDTICDVLFNSPGAPVREALMKAGIGQDLSCSLTGEILQPFVMLSVRKGEAGKLDEMKKIIREELTKIVNEGFNKKSLLATLNRNEFAYREADFGYTPKGIIYFLGIMEGWLYNDNNAFIMLDKLNVYSELRKRLETRFFEEIVEKYMLNSEHEVFVTLEPKIGYGKEQEEKLAAKLAAYKESLGEEGVEKLIEDNAKLRDYQTAPDTAEALEAMPKLAIEDLTKNAKDYSSNKESIDGVFTLHHDINTNGIAYIRLLFDADKLPVELIPYASLATRLFGVIDTEQYSYLELDNEVNTYTGGIATDISTYSIKNEDDAYRPMFVITGRSMKDNLGKLYELIGEEILHTDFTSLTRIREVLGETKTRLAYRINTSGSGVAIGRAESCIFSVGEYKERVGGITFYEFIKELVEQSDEELVKSIAKVKEACAIILKRENLMLDITCEKELFEEVKSGVTTLMTAFGTEESKTLETHRGITFKHENKNEGFRIPGEVTYLAAVGRFPTNCNQLAGVMSVIGTILSSEYLWNNVRVLGGAYGCGFAYSPVGGRGLFYSYRDPHLKETYEVYKNAVDFIRNFDVDEATMTKFIIGTIGAADTPLSPSAQGNAALIRYLSGVDFESVQKARDAVIGCTTADIRRTATVLEAILDENNICAVGSETIVNENSEMFKTVRNVL